MLQTLVLMNTYLNVSYKVGLTDAENDLLHSSYVTLQDLIQEQLTEEILESRLPAFVWIVMLVMMAIVKTIYFLIRDVFFR